MSKISCTVVHNYEEECAQLCTILCTINELVYAYTIVYDFRCVLFCTPLYTNSCATVYEVLHKLRLDESVHNCAHRDGERADMAAKGANSSGR